MYFQAGLGRYWRQEVVGGYHYVTPNYYALLGRTQRLIATGTVSNNPWTLSTAGIQYILPTNADSLNVNNSVSIGGSITMNPAPTGVGGVYFDDSVVGVGTLIIQAGGSSGQDFGVGRDLGVVRDAYIDGDIIGFGGSITGYNIVATPVLLSNYVNATEVNTPGITTAAGGFSTGDAPVSFSIVGSTITLSVAGIGSTTLTLA